MTMMAALIDTIKQMAPPIIKSWAGGIGLAGLAIAMDMATQQNTNNDGNGEWSLSMETPATAKHKTNNGSGEDRDDDSNDDDERGEQWISDQALFGIVMAVVVLYYMFGMK